MLDPIFLCGPTAVGKSALALQLAQRIGGEIISVDSMQVYRGMDIGTAKPTQHERALVPHHLIDILNLDQSFDAAKFVELARLAAAEITQRGHRPVYCGGTGLYFKTLFEGVGDAPQRDPALRIKLERTPLTVLLAELEQTDPIAFARIDRKNPRRVVRAIEVIRLTGRPFSSQRADWKPGVESAEQPSPGRLMRCLRRNDTDLRRRIERRVDVMFATGLVVETECLLRRGLAENQTAMQAIGYRQVVEHLRGECSLAETISLVKTKTWQFTRRQMTWFRRQLAVLWIEVPEGDISGELIASLARELPK